MSFRAQVDRWFNRQPGWIQGALLGGFSWGAFNLAMALSDVGGWSHPALTWGRIAYQLGFGLACGGVFGGVYTLVRTALAVDRLWVDVLGGTTGFAVVLLPIAFLVREMLGAWWPAYALALAGFVGGLCLAPMIRAYRRHPR